VAVGNLAEKLIGDSSGEKFVDDFISREGLVKGLGHLVAVGERDPIFGFFRMKKRQELEADGRILKAASIIESFGLLKKVIFVRYWRTFFS
jgi:hypothetical protein